MENIVTTKVNDEKKHAIIREIISKLQNISHDKEQIFICIAGIPGAGKTSLSEELNKELPNSIVIPLDGYHIYKKELNEEQLLYRGRYDTFDLQKFKNDLIELRNKVNSYTQLFPSFAHEDKDPVGNKILVNNNHKFIIFEGLYLLIKDLNVYKYFDIKIFLQTDIESALKRVAIRNFNAGISQSLEDSTKRTNISDRKNAEFVINNSLLDETMIFNYIED